MLKNFIGKVIERIKSLNKTNVKQTMYAAWILLLLLFIYNVTGVIKQENNKNSQIVYAGAQSEFNKMILDSQKSIAEKTEVAKTDKTEIPAPVKEDEKIVLESKNKKVETTTVKKDTKKTKKKDKKKEEKRENIIYYVIDDGAEFYLDAEYQDYIWKKLKEYECTELYKVVLATAYHESHFKLDAISNTNDHGLMQINAGNYNWLHKELGIDSLDDPYDNIDCGVYILCTGYEKYNNAETALVYYNQGHVGSVKSTRYSKSIMNDDINKLQKLEIK